MRMSNRWNRFVYRVWAPIYDALLERLFSTERKRAMEVAGIQPGARVCLARIIHHCRGTSLCLRHHSTFTSFTNTTSIRSVTKSTVMSNPYAICSLSGELSRLVGIGTGTDLLLLPHGARAVGVDLSEAMLARARKKLPLLECNVELRAGDAQALPFDDGSFDVAVLNLILSVVPDAALCLGEALRVLKADGRIVVLDKFLPDNSVHKYMRADRQIPTGTTGREIAQYT